MVTAVLTAARFVLANWKWFLIGALALALGVSRFQLATCRADFASFKIAGVEAARIEQKRLDDAAHAADKLFWENNPKIIKETETIIKWAEIHVKNVAGCPTPDLISVYNASLTGQGQLAEGTSVGNTVATGVQAEAVARERDH